MSLRVSESDGSGTRLPDGAELKGMQLVFQGFQGTEARYQGSASGRNYLVREVSLQSAADLQALRSEANLLKALSLPVLPELSEAFQEAGYAYLVTVFPQGIRLDQKMARKNVSSELLAEWWGQWAEVHQHLRKAGLGWSFRPQDWVRTRSDQLRCICLGDALSAPKADPQGALAEFFGTWVDPPIPDLKKRLDQLFQGSALAAPVQADSAAPPGRVQLAEDARIHVLAPGTRLAVYEVEFLRRGGMSLCYLGKNGENRRFIKEVRCDDEAEVSALKREYEAMRKLQHPQIPRAHELFQHASHLYLVTDFIEGTSLAQISRERLISEQELADWGLQLCQLLEYLHAHNPPFIYRDLKPANVLVDKFGRIHLIDFGLLRTHKRGKSRDTQALGTFSTASPEHFKGQTDGRSDLFSLGATLFLLAYPDFKPKNPFTFPPLRQHREDLSTELEDLLARCLQQRTEDRWSSAAELAQQLKRGWNPPEPSLPRRSVCVEDLLYTPGFSFHLSEHLKRLLTLRPRHSTLAEALEELAQNSPVESLGLLWQELAQELRSGQKWPEVLGKYPKIFGMSLLDSLSRQSGEGLDLLARQLEKDEQGRRSAGSDPPQSRLVVPPRRSRSRVGQGMGLALAGGAAGGLTHSLGELWQISLGSSLLVWTLGLTFWAFRDSRLLRIVARTQSLIEDAWTSYSLGESEKAAHELTQALSESKNRLGEDHLNTLASLHSLANLYREGHQFDRAEVHYQQALRLYQRALPEGYLARSHLHRDWAICLEAQKKLEQALSQTDEALALARKDSGECPQEEAELLFRKGRLHFELQQDQPASEHLATAMEMLYSQLGLRSPLVHQALSYLTRVYVRQNRFKESEKHLSALLNEAADSLNPDHRALAEANLDMGLVRLETGRAAQAEPYFLRALQLLQHFVGPDPRLLRRILSGYCQALGEDAPEGVVQFISLFAGDRERLRQALERQPELVNARDQTGWGPLQWATFIGRDDIVRWLLSRGAQPSYDSSLAMGPLHVACAWDRVEALFALLEYEPDVNARGPGNWTPLFWASLNGHARPVEAMLKKGADPNCVDEHGRTALHLAAANNRLKVVAALLGAGASVNAVEPRGRATALHMAAERGFLGVCDCLIFNGADLTSKDAGGLTPSQLAQRNQHRLLVRALKKHLSDGLGRGAPGR